MCKNWSHSTWVRELKSPGLHRMILPVSSHSTWVRELKFLSLSVYQNTGRSHSTWVRELKCSISILVYKLRCRTPRECVSWNFRCMVQQLRINSRTPRECVSWNGRQRTKNETAFRRTPRECVSWNKNPADEDATKEVALHVSAWVEISAVSFPPDFPRVALHVSAWVEMTIVFESRRRGELHSTWVCKLKSTFSLASIACIKSLSPY